MKMIINKKQITLLMLSCLFLFLGCYAYTKDINTVEMATRDKNDIHLGDVELVSANIVENEDSFVVPNEELEETSNEIKKVEDDYFSATKLERENMYSETIEVYEKIVNNDKTPEDQKAIAVNEISSLTKIKNGISVSENLIKNKGFEDVVILVNNGAVNVIVRAVSLSKEDITKIKNIIQREIQVDPAAINITNK